MADTGWKSPSGCNAVYIAWAFSTRAYVSNDSRADGEPDKSEWNDWHTFAFSVPSGATIDGIEIELEGLTEGTSADAVVMLSYDGGTNWTSTETHTFTSGTDETLTYGGATDTWDRVWSDSEFTDGTFLVAVQAINGTKNDDINLDHLQVKVYYTETEGGTSRQYVSPGRFMDR